MSDGRGDREAGKLSGAQVVGGLFLVLGVGLFAVAARLYAIARASRGWSSVPGKVTASRLDSGFEPGGSSGRQSHRLRVEYRYEVDGRAFTGRRIRFGDDFWTAVRSRTEAERLLASYPKGREVEVYFDPARPGRSTLTRNFEAGPYYKLFAVAAGLALAGVAILSGAIRVRE